MYLNAKRKVIGLVTFYLLTSFTMLLMAQEQGSMRKIGSISIPWQDYEKLVQQKSLPTLPEMTDRQLAEKLDLTRPNLAGVKKDYDAGDDKALEKALSDYLNTIWKAVVVTPTGKPPANAAQTDPYLQTSVEVAGVRYELGEHCEKVNWWNQFAHTSHSMFVSLEQALWLSDSYAQSGDLKYAERAMDFIRSFYHNARPPAQRENGWNAIGPWSKGSQRFYPSYMPVIYRQIGASTAVTDADRVMILKMASENGDYFAKVFEVPTAHNFLVLTSLNAMDLVLAFRDFKNQPMWLKRVADGLNFNINAAVGEDGGAYERTGYHFAFLGPYRVNYQRLADANAPLPPSFMKTVENMHQWSVWMLTPTKQWPQFGHGSLGKKADYVNFMQGAVKLFPDAKYIRYFVTDGKEGEPLNQVARVMIPSGFATMRTDWSEDALYMSIKHNSFLRGAGGCHDALSFALFAYGIPWMTPPGTTVGYGELEHDDYDMDTLAHNTIRINWRRHDIEDNTGRLENWASLPENAPGFTYISINSQAYASQNADHRRAVLFLRPALSSILPGYWLMYDTVEFPPVPSDFDSYPYDITWLGHFQPTKLTIDSKTKITVTEEKEGKRLYVVPLEPDHIQMQEDQADIRTANEYNRPADYFSNTGRMPDTDIGPYIKLRKKAAENFGVAFGVVLFPTRNNVPAPMSAALMVFEDGKPVTDRIAIGARVTHAGGEDVLAMAKTPALRAYGEGNKALTTDGENAYVRLSDGHVAEAGLVRGSTLEYQGVKLINASLNITAVHISREGSQLKVDAYGQGEVEVSAGGANQFMVNGHDIPAKPQNGLVKLPVGIAGKIVLSQPSFSTDPREICAVLNVPYGHHPEVDGKPETGYLGPKRSLVIKWSTSVPADSILEYRITGEKRWLRTVNPEFLTGHRFVISRIIPGSEYEMRITCIDADGRLGRIESRIPKSVTRTVRQ